MDVRLQDREQAPVPMPLRPLLAIAGVAMAGSLFLAAPPGGADVQTIIIALGAILVIAAGLAFRTRREDGTKRAGSFIENDPGMVILTDRGGAVLRRSAAALGLGEFDDLAALLGSTFADPRDATRTLFRALDETGNGSYRTSVKDHETEVTVHEVERGLLIWRVVRRPCRERVTAVPVVGVSSGGTILWRNGAAEHMIGSDVLRLDAFLESSDGAATRLTEGAGGAVEIREFPDGDGGRQVCLLPVSGMTPPPAPEGMLEALPIPMLRLGPGGSIEWANAEASDLIGRDRLVGLRLGEVVGGLGRSVDDWIDRGLSGRGLNRPETVQVTHTRKEVHARVILSRIVTRNGPRVIAALSDATELKTLEAQFVQSQKMQAIGQLAGGIAHDFNNLLTAISGHCDLMRHRRSPGDPDWADLEQVSVNTERAAALVRQLLAFSRKQTLELACLDLRDTLSDLTCLLNRLVGERVSIGYDHDADLARVRGDYRQMEQVLMNLVVNARDAMGQEGGSVTISTRNRLLMEPLDRDVVEIPAGRYVVVQVADEGPGIPIDVLPKIFEPFFTTKEQGKGTGLGLSTVYGIVKQSDGYIFADERPGGGTVFSLWFPAVREASARPAPPPPDARPFDGEPHPGIQRDPKQGSEGRPRSGQDRENARPAERGVVLLCEDEAPVRAFAARALALRGFDVVEADCGEAALAALNGMASAPDVIVTDVIMPGLDGPGWTRRALETYPGTPVVFMSGYTEGALDDLPASGAGASFLPKPFSLDALLGAVEASLRASGRPPS